MSKHMPGPWTAREYFGEPGRFFVYGGPDGKPIVSRIKGEANARLIAAAPQLLESCKALLEELRLIRDKDSHFVYDVTCRIQARAAIDAAEGLSNENEEGK